MARGDRSTVASAGKKERRGVGVAVRGLEEEISVWESASEARIMGDTAPHLSPQSAVALSKKYAAPGFKALVVQHGLEQAPRLDGDPMTRLAQRGPLLPPHTRHHSPFAGHSVWLLGAVPVLWWM